LSYTEEAFQTEARAVLAEYNKDFAEPFHLLHERLRETAFDAHPYQHTTMGFLRDIERMPTLFAHSIQFHQRYYRPEYTTLILVGDLTTEEARTLVEQHWGHWPRGSFAQAIPPAPPLGGPREVHVPWPAPTQPLLQIAYRAPAYSDTANSSAALDVLSYLYFSSTSALYEKLALEEQTCDVFYGFNSDHVDPYFYEVTARLKSSAHIAPTRRAIEATVEAMCGQPIDPERLQKVKSHLRYAFAMRMDNSEGIAALLARYVGLRRTPETINRLYAQYDALTPADLLAVARQVFTPANRVTAILETA
jgi:zinc protease